MPAPKTVQLNTGAQMPTLGLGTYLSKQDAAERAVEHALKSGYRHIDTATGYGNEEEVGRGIRASGVPREDIFLTTKLQSSDHKNVPGALDYSLAQLGTPYLDLWLMHWPCPTSGGKPDLGHDWLDTWRVMEKIHKENPDKIRAISVSNLSVQYLQKLLAVATVVPAVNQIEAQPMCMQEDIVEECRKNSIVVTSYSPLGSDGAPLLENGVVKRLAEKYKVSPANILISLQANRPGVTVIPKSVTPARIEQNAIIVDLSDEDVQELTDIEKETHRRMCTPYWSGWGNIGFPDLE